VLTVAGCPSDAIARVEEVIVDEHDSLDDPQIQAVADRLELKFSDGDGVLTADEVDDVVRDSAERFRTRRFRRSSC
jgi:hypothetical protein